MLDERFGPKIESARSQWRGNGEQRTTRGIGVLSRVYVNPKAENFRVIDFRILSRNGRREQARSVEEILRSAEQHRRVPFLTVLMESWYVTKGSTLPIDGMGEKEEKKGKTL